MGYVITGRIGTDKVDKDGNIIPASAFHLDMCDVDFNCPWCEYAYTAEWYEEQLNKSKHGLIYKACKICKKKIGITFCPLMGDVVVWLKEKESKITE